MYQPKASPDRSLGVIFMRLRVPEVGEHTVAHVPSDISLIAFDSLFASVLIRAIYVAKVFRVELLG
jgi:hypothetical protein